jgi:hypothetical protein
MHSFAVMTDTTGLLGEIGRLLGIAGADESPSVNEDLRDYLFGDSSAISSIEPLCGAGTPDFSRR